MKHPIPWSARVVGAILAVFGVIDGIGFALDPPIDARTAETTFSVLGTILCVTGGIGLLLSLRGGWALAVAATVWGIAYGIFEFLPKQTVPFPGVPGAAAETDPTALTFLVLPAVAMLAALLAPVTRRWLRRVEPPT